MMKLGKTSFGFNLVQSGQKNATVNAEPQLVANSTQGKFVLTSPVTKTMGLAPGDYVAFINNYSELEAAIASRNEDIVAFATEKGYDIETLEGVEAIKKDLGAWAIVKGLPQFDKTGTPIMVKERFTKEDKEKFIKNVGIELVNANRDTLIERVGNPDASDEELLAAITVDDVEAPEIQKIAGSKTATTSIATGVGCQLNFTDTSIWNTLKSDLGENKIKKNRVFDVDIKNPVSIEISDGYKMHTVNAYVINFSVDNDPIVRG